MCTPIPNPHQKNPSNSPKDHYAITHPSLPINNLSIALPPLPLFNHNLLPIRHAHLRPSPHTHGENIIHPPSEQEAAHSPDPEREGERDSDEEHGQQDQQRDARPEEGEEEGGEEAQGECAEGEGEEEREGRDGEEELGEDEELFHPGTIR